MGVLLGGFGKLQQGQRYRDLQSKLMNVQSRIRHAQRNTENVQKMITRYEKSANNNLAYQQYYLKDTAKADIKSKTIGKYEGVDISTLSAEEKSAYNTAYSQYSQMMSDFDSQLQMQITQAKQQIEDQVQMMQDIQLEACKQEEDSLNTEKDTLESQMQTAKMDYEACKNMEKEDLQMFKPNYTGGNG